MTDNPFVDAPDKITPAQTRTQPQQATQRAQTIARGPDMTWAHKLKAAVNLLQRDSSSNIPTSRPQVRSIEKLLTPQRRQTTKIKTTTTKNATRTAAAAISLVPPPSQLLLVRAEQDDIKVKLQDYE
ncbi:hypothetical protein MRX96_020802 [Rhipicephalus microplus]